MYTADALRDRYARTSDADLTALLDVGPENLTPESRQALVEEARRRELKLPPAWAGVPVVSTYSQGGVAQRTYPKAPNGARFVAYIVDSLIPAAAIGAAAAIVALTGLAKTNGVVPVVLIGGAIVWSIYYYFTKDGREGGQSIGKGMMDLMVINTKTNTPCTMGESALRAVVMLALGLIPLVGFFIEPIFVLSDPDGRRLGDKAADTQVIRTSDYGLRR
ncbi:MAG TPA: RDD family protein [Gemmatimonadaceae bacterium]|nr:RDD family protein [Gemmatimonadaceae bacterium]